MASLKIIIVSDGKAGHLSQSRGLAGAIAKLTPASMHEVQVSQPDAAHWSLGGSLVFAAGHRTYGPALRIAGRLGCPAIALMNPGWWMRRRFDLSVIPEHDGVAASARVELTVGSINPVRYAEHASPTEGLLLIGGPSKHHSWDEHAIGEQLRAVLASDASVRWTATSSRRTSGGTHDLLRSLADEAQHRLTYVPPDETPVGWVAEQLQRCGVCWVSEDSASMVYEALTAGARVGLLRVPLRGVKPGRVIRGVHGLVEKQWVTRFDAWRDGAALMGDRPRLAEADRVAEVILQRWPRLRQ
ncbi:MAG: ELM1/GtrOC1 family putative glycosyltransferase [Planctomycetota bacterium]